MVGGMFDPIRDIIPVVRPGAADQVIKQWIEHVSEPRHVDFAKLWADHYVQSQITGPTKPVIPIRTLARWSSCTAGRR
jgi:hypothetical protein